jgi:DNA-binding transcriptional LysR family regulator
MIGKKHKPLIRPMSDFDHSDLDGHLLQLLLAVHEEQSITRAAQRLGVTQSAVSHLLDKLRVIVGDPLFVRSGRGIVSTARADLLAQRARLLLEDLRGFVTVGGFDPDTYNATLTIAANDLQRDVLLPTLLRRLQRDAPGVSLRVLPSGVPKPELLRDGLCQALITPRPPDAADLVQKRLFEDHFAVFYDASQREPPATLDDYLAAAHVTVVYEPHRLLEFDRVLAERGVRRRFVASVPGFGGLPAFLRGTPWLATAPSLLRGGVMRGLAWVEPPLPCPTLPMYLVWPTRLQADPLHQWLRRAIEDCVPLALAAAGAAPAR